jgi:hypothetical protein
VYFYELHESDDELFSDALLAHERDFSEDEFFDLVMEARARVIDTFEEDTLVAAVARELERAHHFIYIDDRYLRAAVNVSANEEDNLLAEVDDGDDEGDEEEEHEEDEEEDGDEDEDEDEDEDAAFRTLVVQLERRDLN